MVRKVGGRSTLSRPKKIEPFLIEQGFSCVQTFSGKICDLKKYETPSNTASFANLRVVQVQKEKELDAWLLPIQVSFEFSEEISASFLQIIKQLFVKSKDSLQHFMAFQNDKHVGSASLFLDKNSAGLYNLGVLPSFRKQGVGRALKQFRIQIAKEKGYSCAVIQSSDMGNNLDTKLGFTEYMRLQAYTQCNAQLQLQTISD